ncbi:hypothetical protein Dsin_025560 [Dipteronia sinensis]|uniref:GTP-binding protein n=1 Tax=Dipteronia sinensis TaxID=43782 RepID=A0AAE0DWX6_9ROSI|nr:hypothetical protein Dsin_025560 [Dipteronia sinensis]
MLWCIWWMPLIKRGLQKKELDALLSDKALADVPFLVLGNKIDIPYAASEDELRYHLGLTNFTTGKGKVNLTDSNGKSKVPMPDLFGSIAVKAFEVSAPKSGPKGNVVVTFVKPPKSLLPLKIEFGSVEGTEPANEEMGPPRSISTRNF